MVEKEIDRNAIIQRIEESVVEPTAKRNTGFFNKLISTKEPRINSLMVTDAVRAEIEGYLTMPCLPEDTNPLVYWKDHRFQR